MVECVGFWYYSITVGFYSFVFRILLLVYRQCGQYISFRRSFDWHWSHGGGLAVHKTGKEQLSLYVHSQIQFFLIHFLQIGPTIGSRNNNYYISPPSVSLKIGTEIGLCNNTTNIPRLWKF